MVSYILTGIAGALAIIFILSACFKVSPVLRTLLKFVAGLGFTSVAVASYLEGNAKPLFFILILLGLIFGMAGDFLLAMREVKPKREDAFTMGGIGAFLVGHIFYVVLFCVLSPMSYWEPILAAIGAAILVLALKYLFKMQFKNLFIPVCIYCAVILFMLFAAIFTYIAIPATSTLLLLIGAILFVISDFILSFIYFSPKKVPILGLFNLTSYFSAQILIALSLLFL